MNYLSLYRKWRPQTFEEVVGQRHITQTLANAVKQNRVSHAYLFCGPRGTGKTSTAKILAKALNCINGPTATPCNNCHICQQITTGSSIDVLEIDAASNRGIDEIRDLREKVKFSPTEGRKKVYIIDEVHMLTPEAFNALLKTLEEPPSHVVFILATTEPRKVLPTILSRCQRFDFRRITVSEMVKQLQAVAKREKIKVDEAALPLIAQQAHGSLRDALSTLEQLNSFKGERINVTDVAAFLGAVESELLFELTDIVSEKDTSAALFFVGRLVDAGHDLTQFVKDLIGHLRNLFILQNVAVPAELIDTTPEILAQLEAQANHFQPFELMRFVEILTETQNKMRWNTDARLFLEMALLEMTKPAVDVSLSGLLYRIEELEKGVQSPKSEVQSPKSEVQSPKSEVQSPKSEEVVAELALPQESKVQSQKPEAAPSGGGQKTSDKELIIDLERVKRAWPVVLDQVKKKKIPAYALLLECQPSEVRGSQVTLKFNERAGFHRGEVEKPTNLALLKQSLKEILGLELEVLCIIEEEKVAGEPKKSPDPVGPHLVRLVQDNFGAEIVDEIKLDEE